MLIPSYYTDKEGANWIKWPFSDFNQFHQLKQRSKRSVIICGLDVHSIAFDNPAVGVNNFLRWDCVNGFNQ